MEDLPFGYLIGLLLFLLLCSAFFSSTETSLIRLNRHRLRQKAKKGHRAARRASKLLERPDRLLGTVLIGNTFVTVLASAIATLLALRLWGEAGIAIAILGLTLALSVVGTIIPKALAAIRPELLAYPFSLPLAQLQKLLNPLLILLGWISKGLSRLAGIIPHSLGEESLTSEELRNMVHESGQTLPLNRQGMLLGILDLERVSVNDIMIPRNEVVGIDLDETVEQIARQLCNTSHTRLPVFRGDINQVEGVVHMRHIARLLTENRLTKENLYAVCQEPYFVPENTPLATQLIHFQQQKRRIAIVVDEYGDVQGIVTLEDILEEIVGEFTNRDSLPAPDIQPQGDGTQIIDGAVHIREVNKALGWQLPSDGPRTLNGLITEALQSIPDCGVCLSIGPYRLEILETMENRVKNVRIWETGTRLPSAPTAE